MPAATRWTAESIPDQTGRTILVTGANAGLGFVTAEALARRGADVVLACRDPRRAEAAAARILAGAPTARIEIAALDLGSMATARRHADAIAGRFPRIDVLINNAGVMYPPLTHTEDGFELVFVTSARASAPARSRSSASTAPGITSSPTCSTPSMSSSTALRSRTPMA